MKTKLTIENGKVHVAMPATHWRWLAHAERVLRDTPLGKDIEAVLNQLQPPELNKGGKEQILSGPLKDLEELRKLGHIAVREEFFAHMRKAWGPKEKTTGKENAD